MSSFSNSPIIILHLLLLILSPPFIDHAQKLIAAAYTLTEIECFSSETPKTCMKCVESDPGYKTADKVGIAIIVVNCISNQAENLAANVSNLAWNEKDLELMNIYLSCSTQYSSAKTPMLDSAKQSLQNHDYDSAKTFVGGALQFDQACHDNCKGFQDIVPSDVFDRMRNFEELSEAASRIIERLK